MPSASPEPHGRRQVAESFGIDPERYDRTRPSYPQELVRGILAAIPGTNVLDVGCGTGIAARQFRQAGCEVLGVEPDARMAEFARGTGIPVDVTTFEDFTRGDRHFDAVVSGQSWHWVDPTAGATNAARVLRPGGMLAVFWHAFELPHDVADAFATEFERVVPEAPFSVRPTEDPLAAYEHLLAKAEDGIRETGAFGDPHRWQFEWERSYSRAEWLDQLPTQGALTRLDAEQQTQILRSVEAAIEARGGRFMAHYSTVAVTATARSERADH